MNIEKNKLMHAKSEFDYILKESFLGVYSVTDDSAKMGYDAVLNMGDVSVYLLHEISHLHSDKGNVAKADLYTYSKKTVNELMRRHLKLQKTFKKKLGLSDDSDVRSKMYFVGLASLMVAYNEESYSIDHQFGSNYFQEQMVLDFDGDDNLLQLFGTKSFLTILKLLATPIDTLSYLAYHRNALVEQEPYKFETILANSFLRSPQFFDRAVNVEKQLIDIDVLDKHDSRLMQAVSNEDSKNTEELINKMRQFSDLWIKLLQETTIRHIREKNPLSKKIINHLISESLYTRMKMMEDVFGYANQTQEKRDEGYILYQHSYSQFGRQYMIVLYGLDKNSWLSREAVQRDHVTLLINLNSQLQDPVMDDLLLLGFDMSDVQANGDVNIQMDVFHLTASKMTELEHFLHKQLVELREKYQALKTAKSL